MEPHANASADYYDYDELNETDYSMLCQKESVRTFIRSFLPAFYSVVFLLGLAGNALVVVIFACFKKLKTETEVYIMNLAIVDLLLLLTLPFWAAMVVHGWVFGPALCKITSAIYSMSFSASMQFLACISIDRYNAIVRFQGHPRVRKKCSNKCCLVWMAATFLSIPDLIFNTVHDFQDKFICFSSFPENLWKPIAATIEILEVSLSFALPFLIMLVCYSCVVRALTKNPNVKKHQPLKVLAAVAFAFIVTQLPYNVLKIWRAIDIIHYVIADCNTSKTFDIAFQITKSMALFHCCLNPILYFFIGTSFKAYMVKIAKHFGSWRRKQSTAAAEEIPMDHEDSEQHTSSLTI